MLQEWASPVQPSASVAALGTYVGFVTYAFESTFRLGQVASSSGDGTRQSSNPSCVRSAQYFAAWTLVRGDAASRCQTRQVLSSRTEVASVPAAGQLDGGAAASAAASRPVPPAPESAVPLPPEPPPSRVPPAP